MAPARARAREDFSQVDQINLLESLDLGIVQQELCVQSVFQEEKTLHYIIGALRSTCLKPKRWREFVLDTLGAVPDCYILLHQAADKVRKSSEKEMRDFLEQEYRKVQERSFIARLTLYRLKEEYIVRKRNLKEG